MHRSAHGPIGTFRHLVQNQYYMCTSQTLTGPGEDVQFSYVSGSAGPIRVDRMSGGDVLVERSWSHVRASPSEIYLIRFPERGELNISQDNARNSTVGTGEFIITYGNRPFQAKAIGLGDGKYSQIDIVVPSHILRSQLPEVDQICGKTFKLQGGASVAQSIASELIHGSGRIGADLSDRLARISLEAVVSEVSLQRRDDSARYASRPSDLSRVLQFIDANFSIPGLTGESVARACRMSRRHLNNVMLATGLTFAEYLWDRRLEQAHQWLSNDRFGSFTITQIAHMSGFQCGSHFSKTYKRRFGNAPRLTRMSPNL